MWLACGFVIKQGEPKVDLAITVIVVFNGIEKSIVIGIGILHNFFDTRRQRFGRGRLNAAVKLSVLVDRPSAPLGSCEMKLTIKDADIEIATSRVVLIKLTTISERICLRMTI